jgi:hypothetical protein
VALLDQQTRYVYLLRAEFADPEREQAWNRWYDEKHVPELLTVPGIVSATRYQQRGARGRYLAAYEIESPDVFDEPRYAEVTGWGEWAPYITEWRRAVYEVVEERPT